MNLVNTAQAFAIERHAGQQRKYTGEPYINHPAAVVELVRTVPHTAEMLAAAWLHDVVEDTPTEQKEIFDLFGPAVALYVSFLTDQKVEGNRAFRKQYQANRLAAAPPAAQTIKLADLIDNTSSIVEHDPKFAVTYMKEKSDLLIVLTRGDDRLWHLANAIITELRGEPIMTWGELKKALEEQGVTDDMKIMWIDVTWPVEGERLDAEFKKSFDEMTFSVCN